jgi:putative cell wall-binding protein/Tol biopolymer transport system component
VRKDLFRWVASAAAVGTLLAASIVVGGAPADASSIGGGVATVVSARADGAAGDKESSELAMSRDGRYVAFTSKASNLGAATASTEQIYRKDRQTGEILLVSANAAGQPGVGRSTQPSISADGTRVAFSSDSANLDGGTADRSQVFVRDLATPGGATLVTRTSSMQAGNGYSSTPAISADGRTVAFSSAATDLVKDATSIGTNVFVAALTSSPPRIDFVSLQNRKLSPDLANASATDPAISADGTIITFTSAASNLTSDPVPAFRTQIWMRNLVAGTTVLVSRGSTGAADSVDSGVSAVSSDGSKVAYMNGQQIRLRDVPAGTTSLISQKYSGASGASGSSYAPLVSDDGRVVTFRSNAADLTTASAPNSWSGYPQLYRRDLRSGTTTMMSTVAGDATRGSGQGVNYGAMSGDGSVVGFSTNDGSITAPATNGTQIFARTVADPSVDRIGGADRYAVAVGVGTDTFGPSRDVVYVATGASFADALSASAAAGASGAPVLLVTKDAIPTETGAELARLKPRTIVLAGGLDTISAGVESALKKYGETVERIGGADRYAVSAAMAARAFPTSPVETVYLASGQVFPDALAGAAATGGTGPVLLVTKDGVPDPVREQLNRLAPAKIVVLGGANTISEAVLATLPTTATVTRLGGADRYAVSAGVSASTFDPHVGTAYIASGAVFPDALSGSAAAIANHGPVLLVTKDAIPDSVATELTRLKPRRIVVLGGANTIAETLEGTLRKYLVP